MVATNRFSQIFKQKYQVAIQALKSNEAIFPSLFFHLDFNPQWTNIIYRGWKVIKYASFQTFSWKFNKKGLYHKFALLPKSFSLPFFKAKITQAKNAFSETCQVFSFDRLYLITFRAKNTQKLTLLTYFTIIERKQAKWTKSIGVLYNVWKSFPSGSLYEQYWHKQIRLLTPLLSFWGPS